VGPRVGLFEIARRRNPCICQVSNPYPPPHNLVTVLADNILYLI